MKLLKMILILTEMVYCVKKYIYIFNKLLVKRASECADIKNEVDPNKLIYSFRTEGKIPKDFNDDRMPLELLELSVCSYHVTCAFRSESFFYSCLNVKKRLARNRHNV